MSALDFGSRRCLHRQARILALSGLVAIQEGGAHHQEGTHNKQKAELEVFQEDVGDESSQDDGNAVGEALQNVVCIPGGQAREGGHEHVPGGGGGEGVSQAGGVQSNGALKAYLMTAAMTSPPNA